MSQFRIKKIDQGLPDEWVYRLNDLGAQIGDDIDARDPNELAESILDTQTLLLKTSKLSPSVVIKTDSGLAERLTLLEQTAGQAGLQDVYVNGSSISILNGRPFVVGAREEIKVDDSGNVSFNPVSFRVKGVGATYLSLSGNSVYSTLTDLMIGAVSPGTDLNLIGARMMSFKDNYLVSPIYLSESGQSRLETISQSLVGAINELKNSSFNVSFQSVYNQSSPPRVLVNMAIGAITFENANANAIGDTFKVIGNQTITKKLTVTELKIGANASVSDAGGIKTTSKIESTTEIATPVINSGIQDLKLQDKRIQTTLSEDGVSVLKTSRTSIIGAINELKDSIDNVGGAQTYFGQEHDGQTGVHGIITTKAATGQDAANRIIVKDSLGVERVTVSGDGQIKAEKMTLSGKDVVDLLNKLSTHILDDGRSHVAVASHIAASNPHGNVKSIQGLSSDISLTSADSSVSISTSGQSINLSVNEKSTMQDGYNRLLEKKINIDTSLGLKFNDATSSETIMMLRNIGVLLNRNINFEFANAKITATTNLTLDAATGLSLVSQTDNVAINAAQSNKTVVIQGVPFSSTTYATLSPSIGTSILEAVSKLGAAVVNSLTSGCFDMIAKGSTVSLDQSNQTMFPISTLHPANEFVAEVDFYHNAIKPIGVNLEDVTYNEVKGFFKQAKATVDTQRSGWILGQGIYIAPPIKSKIKLVNPSSIVAGNTITISPTGINKAITAVSTVPNQDAGEFKIETSSVSANINADKTRNNIVAVINNRTFNRIAGKELNTLAGISGEEASAVIELTTALVAGDVFEITPHADTLGTKVTFMADAIPSTYSQFKLGRTAAETARNLAETINKTTYFSNEARTLTGHYCVAEVDGKTIYLKWYMPGFTGRNTTLSTSSANVTIYPFTGGTCELEMFKQTYGEASDLEYVVQSSNTSAITTTNFPASLIQYAPESEVMSRNWPEKYDRKLRIGTVIGVADTVVTMKVEL